MELGVLTKEQISEIVEAAANLTLESFQKRLSAPFPDVMNMNQICEYLHTTPPTIRNKIKHGLPVSYVLGEKTPRFMKSDIDAWLKGHL